MRRFGRRLLAVVAGALLVALAGLVPAGASGSGASSAVPHYDHLFLVVEENHGYSDVIGNPAAPNLNALARRFGSATAFYGVAHPSEPNYVALLGGSTFGVQDDNPYYMNRVAKPSLISQLDEAGIGWKAYLQGLPYAGYRGMCYPAKCNGSPDVDPLYVSKHNAIQNFTTSLNARDWSRQVPIEQLSHDLGKGSVPAFNYVIPDECHDMHGDPPYCIDSGTPGDPQDQRLVATGDQYLGQLVAGITGAPFWAKGNNAIAIVFDEGDDKAGCCGTPSGSGGGRVASVIVTSHGPRGLQDATPANHYSLLQTIQKSFGLGCLAFTCDTADVKPLASLLAVKGTAAIATKALPVPDLATPTPTPVEPVSSTSRTPSAAGWSVVSSPMLGTADNSLGAVATGGPNDVWAVGNFLPDTATSNQDATLPLAVHYDGSRWSVTPTPNVGPNFNTLFGVAASGGRAWAVGVALDNAFRNRALIEAWDGSRWTVAANPQPGSVRDQLFGVSAASAGDVWAVGDQQGTDGTFRTLVEHWNGTAWSVVPSPNPGVSGNELYAVTALAPDDVWAVGQQLGRGDPDQALIEHWDGSRWRVVPSPRHGSASAALYGVAGSDGQVWAVGETDDSVAGARPLVEQLHDGAWRTVDLPAAGSIFTNLWGVTVAGGSVWAVGTYVVPSTGNNGTLILRGERGTWSVVQGPDPGPGGNILAGVVAAGDTVWAVGHYHDGGRKTLIERHQES
jgi:Phosphoesterase family